MVCGITQPYTEAEGLIALEQNLLSALEKLEGGGVLFPSQVFAE
jgi:hypothetical protein